VAGSLKNRLISWNDYCHNLCNAYAAAAGARHGRLLESMTSYQKSNHVATLYINEYLLEEELCQISSRSDLKWQSLRLHSQQYEYRLWVSECRLL